MHGVMCEMEKHLGKKCDIFCTTLKIETERTQKVCFLKNGKESD